ncbi:poly(3-hydroxybutyrate) depolymerase [Dankookia rubra]|uniref:Poly(3-hydroxybutyrate) depolymerase n=1 Tax=Dankookia rubra TaxID=1442381 RepID=A0A4R5Q6U6_9PROT|nr:PHB depolymerase family esterase [Dankookia rubra]TDH58273.1 poly(3-hydroxybutyrate) depolymerase [Dankookia rubra]
MTVSGLSSGGFIAHQFHIAHSDLVRGAGIVAGGPFGCAERVPNPWVFGAAPLLRAQAATLSCTHVAGATLFGLPVPSPRVEDSLVVIAEARRAGTIAAPSHLAGTRVWLFRGEADELVPRKTFDALVSLYRQLGVAEPNLMVRPNNGPKAAHGMPVSDFPERGPLPARACGIYGPPFINRCGFDAAGEILTHLYGPLNAPGDATGGGELRSFDQRPFVPPAREETGMAAVGWVYVPKACGQQRCNLHVVFHGCQQDAGTPPSAGGIGADFLLDAGYNRWAVSNHVVIVYPQVTGTPLNPRRCWDWWGYSGDDYLGRDAPQIAAVRAMVARLLDAR